MQWIRLILSTFVTQQDMPVVSGLIDTVDRVMEHMVTNLESSPKSLVSLDGTSFVAGLLAPRETTRCSQPGLWARARTCMQSSALTSFIFSF